MVRGGPARGIQPVQPRTVPQEHEGIAAQAVGDRFGNGQGNGRGYGGIRRAAAGEHHAQAGLRRQGL